MNNNGEYWLLKKDPHKKEYPKRITERVDESIFKTRDP
jgi:hypothetical protein